MLRADYFTQFEKIDIARRRAEACRQLEAHPDRCCVLVAPGHNAPAIDKHKYLVPKTLTLGQFAHVVRKRLRLSGEEALFLTAGGLLPLASETMGTLHEKHCEPDKFLYITYTNENTFGHPITAMRTFWSSACACLKRWNSRS